MYPIAVRTWIAVVVCGVLLAALGCEKHTDVVPGGNGAGAGGTPAAPGGGSEPATPAAGKTALDPASVTNGGSITGIVTLKGSVPTLPALNMAQKPECSALHQSPVLAENIVTGEGGALKDVFVEISGGLENYTFTAPKEPIEIDQVGCIYVPHVFGVMTGQDIALINSDPFLHNVKVDDNRKLNEAMPNKDQRITKRKWFKKRGVPTTFQCEVHPWMRAYACVVEHPYFAVTGAGGKFTISNVPPGKYKVKVWHEVFPGLKAPLEADVEVTEGGTVTVDFEYSI